ncbi:MAG: ArsC family reductase [Gammaproteobacteria bacterium]
MARATLYGIANCDTIRKARRWLEDHRVDYEFYDYRRQGLDAKLLQTLESRLGWEAMLNRKGRSWRQLPESVRERVDRDSALELMLDNPAMIKRPILAAADGLHLGFDAARYEEIFA